MIAKLKELLKSKINRQIINVEGITNKLSDGLFGMMEKSFKQKQNENSVGTLSHADTKKMIDGYAKKNMILAAASSIIPGPLGILTSIPQLVISFGNQMKMVYDIGSANGKENILTKDLLLDIPLAAFGGEINLSAVNQNDKLNNIDSNVLIDKATNLSKNVVQQTLKKSVVNFIPVAGPVMMGIWARASTQKISNCASHFFVSNINPKEEILIPAHKPTTEAELQLEKIKLLCNLVEYNGEVNKLELENLATIIANSSIPVKDQPDYLGEALEDNVLFDINFDMIRFNNEGLDAVMEMIVMACRDGVLDQMELEYIYEVGAQLQVEANDIDELITASKLNLAQ